MTNLYDKSRQLRVYMAIIESQVRFAKDKENLMNKDKSNPQVKKSLSLEKSKGLYR